MQEEEAWTEIQAVAARLSQPEQKLIIEVWSSATAYAAWRCNWRLASIDDRASFDERRSVAHDRFIDAVNALSRACGRNGLSQDWRAIWGDARTGEARKRIGDLACYIAYRISLEGR